MFGPALAIDRSPTKTRKFEHSELNVEYCFDRILVRNLHPQNHTGLGVSLDEVLIGKFGTVD